MMKTTEFCYWLQGLFELATPTQLNAEQTELIKLRLSDTLISLELAARQMSAGSAVIPLAADTTLGDRTR